MFKQTAPSDANSAEIDEKCDQSEGKDKEVVITQSSSVSRSRGTTKWC